MIKFITVLITCSLALAAGVRAAQDPKKKPAPKSVQKQQIVPKQQHPMPSTHVQTMPKTHVQTMPTQHKVPLHNTVTNQPLHTVQPNKVPMVQSNKFQPNKTTTVKTFQSQHVNFHAQPKTTITSARFNQSFRIRGSENWRGANYQVFRSYHPQWHDRGWWHSHHNHVLLIGGGWYYWNAGYWYPAWGYDESAAYYPYDGPIYVGNNPTPLDQVVADVQTTLQEQGYYNGDVDGLVGPLTQEALAAYQSAQGLEQTASIDQPTLESLGLG
jgi:Putative peptidoglycan binding domain